MPSFIRSRAIGSAIASTPPFEAEYAAWPIWPSSAATEAVLMMHAPLAVVKRLEVDHSERRMRDAAEGADKVDLDRQLELLHRIEFGRLGFLVAADRLGGIGDAGAIDQHPLLAMCFARFGECRRDLLVAVTSTSQNTPPISAATFSPRSASRSNTATLAPRRASSRAVASPRPDAAPVTTAAIPLMFMTSSDISGDARVCAPSSEHNTRMSHIGHITSARFAVHHECSLDQG